MDSFIFYPSFLEAIRDFDNDQFGAVMRAITEYGVYGIVPENMDPMTKVVFTLVRPQIDANMKRKEDGAKGGRPSKPVVSETENHGLQKKKPVVSETENHGSVNEKPNDNVNDNVNVNDNDKDNTPLPPSSEGEEPVWSDPLKNLPKDMEERFERFWSAYPKKVGKGDARKAFLKVNPSDALLGQMITAIVAASASYQWQKDKGQFIPNPATWLNQQRWEDEVRPDMGRPDIRQAPPNRTRFANFEERTYDSEDDAIGTAWMGKGG